MKPVWKNTLEKSTEINFKVGLIGSPPLKGKDISRISSTVSMSEHFANMGGTTEIIIRPYTLLKV